MLGRFVIASSSHSAHVSEMISTAAKCRLSLRSIGPPHEDAGSTGRMETSTESLATIGYRRPRLVITVGLSPLSRASFSSHWRTLKGW